MKKQNSKVEVAFFLASVSESGAWWRNQIRSMPLCVKLNGVTAEDLIDAFAIHDLFLGNLACDIGDDDFTVPHALVRKSSTRKRKAGEDPHPPAYWLVFTAYKIGDVHTKAGFDTSGMLRRAGVASTDIFRVFASVEEIFGGKIAKKNFIAFSRYVNSPISLELENFAFERACDAMCVDVPADWHALRAAKRTQLGFDTMDKPTLSAILELSTEPFKPLTKEEAEERFQSRLAQAILDEENARLQAIEDKKKFDEDRLNRYLPTIAEFKDAVEPNGETCVYIFSGAHASVSCVSAVSLQPHAPSPSAPIHTAASGTTPSLLCRILIAA